MLTTGRPYHGTCAIETIIPRLASSLAALRTFAGAPLRRLMTASLGRRLLTLDEPALEAVLGAFGAFLDAIAAGAERAGRALLVHAAAQSGGRVRTPRALAPGGTWTFALSETAPDGSPVGRTLTAPELIAYETDSASGRSKFESDEEIFWILQSVWGPVGTAIALVNQSGMRFWFNAANNRWGGHHPPHTTHRRGGTVDFDVGFGWRNGHKVPNVQKRDTVGFPLSDRQIPDNSSLPRCLHGMDRVAGWVGTQAFILVGVSQYLYGDAALVEQAAMHLEGKVAVRRPASIEGIVDAQGHSDHWHFEVLVGQRPTRIGPFELMVPSANVLDVLLRQARERDADPAFWQRMAGLAMVPTGPNDFKGLPDEEDWVAWWKLREGGEIPLLPIWTPARAAETFGHDDCREPAGDFPRAVGDSTAG